MARRSKPRRGVVLLIVLILLTLLVVTGLTYAILAGHFRRISEARERSHRYGDPPASVIDRAVYQLVRDTNDAASVIRGQSLLRDLYGESLRGRQLGGALFTGGASAGEGQFLEFVAQLALDDDDPPFGPVELDEVPQSMRTDGFLNGCVLTFITGPLQNLSSRIVWYHMDATNPARITFQFRVLVPPRDDPNIAASGNEDLFVLNGRAFSGTGAGYDGDVSSPQYGQLGRVEMINGQPIPQALLPNRFNEPSADTFREYLQGGLNESYDAPDYQNLFLAALVPDPLNPSQVRVLPSFHQPALVNYWANHSSGLWNPTSPGYLDFRRRVVFRPMPWDHPNFDGSNPAFAGNLTDDDLTRALIHGPWDVDCDGDGTADAVWLDLGFPMQTDPSGRRYKPLFAILCTDLDSRLNLNVHGNLSQVAALAPATQTEPVPVSLPTLAGAPISSNTLPAGQGYGPPEVFLGSVLSSVNELQWLMQGNAARGIPGRYGWDGVPGDLGIQTLALLKLLDYPPAWPAGSPTNFFLATTPLSAFSSPYDLRGEFVFGLDYRGQPVYERSTETNLLLNSPYEMNVSLNAPRGVTNSPAADMPFSLAELERLLRWHDVDALSLPDRLCSLIDTFRNDPSARRTVTTDSFDIPGPSIQPWPELRHEYAAAGVDHPRHIVDLLRARLIDARGLSSQLNDLNVIAQLNNDIVALLMPDMVMGLPMDLNRPFGNGQDDPSPVTGTRNGVVDDHGVGVGDFRGEDATNEVYLGGIPFDHDNDGVIGTADTSAFRARHLFAKRLYVLMMAIKPRGVEIDFDGDPTNNSALETAYGIAQWAINVVDFRDADSICTPFEFDIDPFNDNRATNRDFATYGWDVDGVLGTADDALPERGLVWGCERPELLLSEVIAMHQRRTEDLSAGGGTTTSPTTPDEDFDQRLRPRGSFFVEIYNPWAGDARNPGEFYHDQVTGTWSPGVMLNQVTEGPTVRYPVWRLAIAKGVNRDLDPDHWDLTQRLPENDIERLVYFTPFAGPATGSQLAYYTDLPVAPILPGRYAVVGSAGQTVDETGSPLDLNNNGVPDYVTTLGRLHSAIEDGAGGLNYAGTRRIVLEPSLNVNEHQAQVLENQAAIPEPLPPDIQPAVGIVINLPSSLNVTEPITGYPLTGPGGEVWNPTLADFEGAYDPPLDTPLDTEPELVEDKTTNDYCMVHLQRLANPVLPYDPVLNPYLTIDSMSCDLCAFNGVTSDIDPKAGDGSNLRMTTRERGRNLAATEYRALWKHEPGESEGGKPSPNSVREATPLHHQDQVLTHSFGFLNQPYHPYYTTAAAYPVPDAILNRPNDFYLGAPAIIDPTHPPFPWLTWNNRPFVSQYELMLVPKSRSSRLLYEYSIEPLDGSAYAPESPGRYSHLLNFFETSDSAPPAANAGNFYRLFDLTRVPSRFVDTDLYLNPNIFAGNVTPAAQFLHPPFNRISHYRDPGKINLNTIFDERIWYGLLAGHTGPSWQWQEFVTTRRGYGSRSGNILQPDSNCPTYFANPLRAVGAAQLVPTTTSHQLNRLEVESTLLRSSETGYKPNAADLSHPRWENPPTAPHDQHYNNSDRNPYFRYQGLARIGNLVTSRSNVYAVWITMGYFEVEPSPDANTLAGLRIHPDGYRLGRELGSDTGNVKRHRAFYIIDRSIPVAFEPGENHNVDRAIVLRRFIE